MPEAARVEIEEGKGGGKGGEREFERKEDSGPELTLNDCSLINRDVWTPFVWCSRLVGLEFDNFRALITSHACLSNRPVVGEIHSLEAETLWAFCPGLWGMMMMMVVVVEIDPSRPAIPFHPLPPPVAEPRCTLMQGRGRCAGALLRSFNSQDRDIRSLTINQSISVSKVSHKGILIYTRVVLDRSLCLVCCLFVSWCLSVLSVCLHVGTYTVYLYTYTMNTCSIPIFYSTLLYRHTHTTRQVFAK